MKRKSKDDSYRLEGPILFIDMNERIEGNAIFESFGLRLTKNITLSLLQDRVQKIYKQYYIILYSYS